MVDQILEFQFEKYLCLSIVAYQTKDGCRKIKNKFQILSSMETH
jgi:hypothetical protein